MKSHLFISKDDALLETVSKVCESAGSKGREILNIALKDAVA